jgi:hypothetical protein
MITDRKKPVEPKAFASLSRYKSRNSQLQINFLENETYIILLVVHINDKEYS